MESSRGSVTIRQPSGDVVKVMTCWRNDEDEPRPEDTGLAIGMAVQRAHPDDQALVLAYAIERGIHTADTGIEAELYAIAERLIEEHEGKV